MKHDWTRWMETVFGVDVLVAGIPVILIMLLAIWLVWRAFGSW